MKISDLKPGMSNVALKAEVAEMEEPREVNTKFGTTINLNSITLKDESGQIKLVLWGDVPDGMESGKTVEIKNAFVKDFRGELQLGIPKDGEVKVM